MYPLVLGLYRIDAAIWPYSGENSFVKSMGRAVMPFSIDDRNSFVEEFLEKNATSFRDPSRTPGPPYEQGSSNMPIERQDFYDDINYYDETVDENLPQERCF